MGLFEKLTSGERKSLVKQGYTYKSKSDLIDNFDENSIKYSSVEDINLTTSGSFLSITCLALLLGIGTYAGCHENQQTVQQLPKKPTEIPAQASHQTEENDILLYSNHTRGYRSTLHDTLQYKSDSSSLGDHTTTIYNDPLIEVGSSHKDFLYP